MEGLTLNELLYWSTLPGCVGWAGAGKYADYSLFPEGEDCDETGLETESKVVLDKYLDRQNLRGVSR